MVQLENVPTTMTPLIAIINRLSRTDIKWIKFLKLEIIMIKSLTFIHKNSFHY